VALACRTRAGFGNRVTLPASRVFFGWWIVLAFSVMVFLSTGIRFTVGPFLKPIVADLGLDRASFSLVVALSLFLYGAFMPFVGRLADRVGVRAVVVLGTVVLTVTLAATGMVTSLWQLYLVYGVGVPVGLAATGHVVASAAVARWFTRRRATALSVLGAASMGGMSLLVPVATWLILELGWRQAYGVLAVGALLVILPLAIWLMRESPESMGLLPDGVALDPEVTARGTIGGAPVGLADQERTPVTTALQRRAFWQLAGPLSTCGFSMSLLGSHGMPMLTDHGYHPMVASSAFAVLGGTNVAFAVALGAIADRYGSRPILVFIYGGRAVALAMLFLIRGHPLALLLAAALGGATMAGTFAMTSSLTADLFGRYSVGSVFGTMFLVHQVGAALGSWLGGFIFETTGGYAPAFAIACGVLVIAGALTFSLDVAALAAPTGRPAVARGG
jgi:MFS family permease